MIIRHSQLDYTCHDMDPEFQLVGQQRNCVVLGNQTIFRVMAMLNPIR